MTDLIRHTDPADYTWRAAANGILATEAHAFPPGEDGRLPRPAACGVRWTAAYGLPGDRMCRSCVVALRDQLRAIVVALAKAGIHVDAGYDGYERQPGMAPLADHDAPVGAGDAVEAFRG